MADFTITIENLPHLQNAMRNFSSIANPILQKALQASQFIFQQNTLKNDPVPWKTGNLLQSFRFGIVPFQARWYPTANYAPFVEFGTKPHIIRPVRAQALAWQTGGSAGRYVTSKSGKRYYKSGTAGTMTFAKVVHHPGSRAKPFMEGIVKKSVGQINTLFAQAGDIITREIARQAA